MIRHVEVLPGKKWSSLTMEVLNSLLPDTNCIRCEDVIALEEKSLITVRLLAIQQEVGCPLCGQMSSRIHSRYQRQVADLPWAGIPIRLSLHVRRFFCENCHCPRQIFTERLPAVVAPWGRRTQRLAQSQQQIALALGGAGTAKLSEKLAMPTGIDSALTLIRQTIVPEAENLRAVGVDDWAKRKGQAYGTIVVDLERGTVVDLLPDRTADTVSEWLQKHPGIEIITRDRAGAYAEAAKAGAPEATQVADRWHLLKNMNDALFNTLQQYQSDIEKLLVENNSPSGVP
jgi:transposase